MALNIVQLHAKLKAEFNRAKPDINQCEQMLKDLKLQFATCTFMPVSKQEVTKNEEFVIIREVLEIGAMWSIKKQDIPSFERYIQQLKCYYNLDSNEDEHNKSAYKYQLLGLNLLCLLSQNRVAEFHTELELLKPDEMHNVYIRHPIQLEQYLMEGSYNKIFLAKDNIPAENYNFFIDILIDTVRTEIAACIQKAYDNLSLAEATRMINLPNQQAMIEYGKSLGWTLANDKLYYFDKEDSRVDETVPSQGLSQQVIDYARELEMIV